VTAGYLGLGSNVGDRLANLRAAREELPRHGVQPLRASSVYETEPVDQATGQRDFLNACLRVETGLGPEELLDACKALEAELGRRRSDVRQSPRTIDVDLLLLGDIEHRSERLTLPHPAVARRRFVLLPLLELDPELTLPDGKPLAAALPATSGQRVDRLGEL